MHLDATHDGDAPALMTSMDSLSKMVLANVKVPSEHADYIIPFLRKIQSDFGTPIACVHDMGLGICKAVADVFPGIRDFVCHYHFLRDIGKDFLDPSNGNIRNSLRKHSVTSRLRALVRETRAFLSKQTDEVPLLANAIKDIVPPERAGLMPVAAAYSLALWALQGKKAGNGYGLPFDRPLLEFACRLMELSRSLPDLLGQLKKDDEQNYQYLSKLAKIVSDASKDTVLCQAVEELQWRSVVFDCLRKAMRIAPVDGKEGLNDEGTFKVMKSIRLGVEQFRRELDTNIKLYKDPLCRKMAIQIDKYIDKLFADPIEVVTPYGPIIIYPQRTNNILEQFFRSIRRGYRRRSGNNSMSRDLQAMLADTPLVKNLDNHKYVEMLLDGKASLEELFAEIALLPPSKENETEVETDRILPGFRTLIKLKNLPAQVIRLFA